MFWSSFKYVPLICVFVFGLIMGGSYQKAMYDRDKAKAQQEYIAQLKQVETSKDATINLLIKSMVTSDSLQSAIDKRISRLQYNISADNKRILQSTERITAESVTKCRELLSESTGLLGEGVGLLRDTNRRLEAVINVIDTNTSNSSSK